MFGKLKRLFVPKLYSHCVCEDCLLLIRDYCEGWQKKRSELTVGTKWTEGVDCYRFKPYKQGIATGCEFCGGSSSYCGPRLGSGKQYIRGKAVTCQICNGKGWMWHKVRDVA